MVLAIGFYIVAGVTTSTMIAMAVLRPARRHAAGAIIVAVNGVVVALTPLFKLPSAATVMIVTMAGIIAALTPLVTMKATGSRVLRP